MFVINGSRPVEGDKFFNTKPNGYSTCIQGKPAIKGKNVLCNCVGAATGFFNRQYAEITGYNGMKYPSFNCNAEDFIKRNNSKYKLEVVQQPVEGGIMVWEGKGSLAGHVAFVIKCIDANTTYTAESGYNHFEYANYTRKNTNGRWGLGSNYTYLGCIVNPAIGEQRNYEQSQPKGKYPYKAILKKGTALYNAKGVKYKNTCSKDRNVIVQGEANGRLKVYGDTFSPHIVYCDKSSIKDQNTTTTSGKKYPYNAIIKKGSKLYNANGIAYKNPCSKDRNVQVQGEANGRLKIYGKTFNPNIVYCDKSSIK